MAFLGLRDPRDLQAHRDPRVPEENRDLRDLQGPRGSRDLQGLQDPGENRDLRDRAPICLLIKPIIQSPFYPWVR